MLMRAPRRTPFHGGMTITRARTPRQSRTDEDFDTVFRDSVETRRPGLLRRLLRALTWLAVLLALGFFGGGGWYFAGQINADALTVEHAAPVDTLRLTPAPHHAVTITTSSAGDQDLLDDGATYGVAWAGGYGQVSGTDPAVDGHYTRTFVVLTGTAPAADTPAHLDRSAFPDPVVALDRGVRDVTFHAAGGEVPAWFVPGRGGTTRGTWAVLVHGKGVTRTEMLRPLRDTVAAGMPSLVIDYRNDVGAPRDASGRYQYGRTEWRDLAAALDYARDNGAQRVVLVGASMGGAVIASYLEHSGPRSLPVAGLVLDAPMLSLARTVEYGASRRPLPVLGHVPFALAWTAERIAALRFDVDWGAIDYLDQDAGWLTMPTLVVHGLADTTVPVSTSKQLHADHPDLVTLDLVPGAEHVASWNADPAGYDAALRSFFTTQGLAGRPS